MKKSLSLLTLLICSIVYVNAQVYVDSIGHMSIGTTTDSTMILRIFGNRNGINCSAGNATTLSSVAIEGTAYHKGTNATYGVKGIGAWDGYPNYGQCFGVYGYSYGSYNGLNIGVYGTVIPFYYGAGVYGSSSSYSSIQPLFSNFAGYFDGDVYVSGNLSVSGVMTNYSAPISNSQSLSLRQTSFSSESTLNRINRLEPIMFLMEGDLSKLPDSIPLTAMEQQVLSKQHYGLNAEQLEAVFPDLVYEDENGTKSINYVEMVPILIQAINELKGEINALKGDETTSRDVKKEATGLTKTEDVTLLSLGQNKPNPFGTNTEIEVSIPETVQQAFIYVYDLQGKKVEQVDIKARGKQVVRLSSDNLTDGMYMYSLITDGKVVETRRMIVEK